MSRGRWKRQSRSRSWGSHRYGRGRPARRSSCCTSEPARHKAGPECKPSWCQAKPLQLSSGRAWGKRWIVSGLVTNSILFCHLFKIMDHWRCTKLLFRHNHGLRQLFSALSVSTANTWSCPFISLVPEGITRCGWKALEECCVSSKSLSRVCKQYKWVVWRKRMWPVSDRESCDTFRPWWPWKNSKVHHFTQQENRIVTEVQT